MRIKHTRHNASTGAVQTVRSMEYGPDGQVVAAPPPQGGHSHAAAPNNGPPPRSSTNLLEHSKTHPRMLKSNATSHVWPFGALAELVDNAQDLEAAATTVHIKGEDTITKGGSIAVVDDGAGMTRAQLHCMLGFGFSDKEHVQGNVGRFGIGFKSGSMRLGSDVLVITKEQETTSMALLSQTFLDCYKADDILIPMLTWRNERDGSLTPTDPVNQEEWDWSVKIITQFSFMSSEQAMMKVVASRRRGTAITIFNLKQPSEFQFLSSDIQLRAHSLDNEEGRGRAKKFQQYRDGQQASLDVAEDYSFRSYLEVLYLKPRVNIYLQGKQVIFRDPLKALQIQKKKFGPYTPKIPGVSGSITCWFGYNSSTGKLCGVHLYHKNRLIRMYQRFGSQLQVNCMMKDLLGVAVVDCITPTHNKQDFNTTEIVYSRFKQYLVKMMNTYYFEYQTYRDAGKGSQKKSRKPKRKVSELSSEAGEDSADEDEQPDTDEEDEDDEEAIAIARNRSRVRQSRNPAAAAASRGLPEPQSTQPSNPDTGTQQPDWVQICLGEWTKIYKHRQAAPFKEPVDIELLGCYDYYAKIEEPMDLSTIKTNLERGRYSSPVDFRRDVHLMLNNAVVYNGEAHFVGKYALNLKEFFNKNWEAAKKRFDPALLVEEEQPLPCGKAAQPPPSLNATQGTPSGVPASSLPEAEAEATPDERAAPHEAVTLPEAARSQQPAGQWPVPPGATDAPAVGEPQANDVAVADVSVQPTSSAAPKPVAATNGQARVGAGASSLRPPPRNARRQASEASDEGSPHQQPRQPARGRASPYSAEGKSADAPVTFTINLAEMESAKRTLEEQNRMLQEENEKLRRSNEQLEAQLMEQRRQLQELQGAALL